MANKKDEFEATFGPEDHPTAEDVREATRTPKARARAAANARIYGAPWDWIADTFEYQTPASARVAVEAVLSEMNTATDYTAARNLARAQLTKLQRKAMSKAMADTIKVESEKGVLTLPNEDQLRWLSAAIGVTDRLIRLDGLDAPQRVELRVPEAAEFDQVVRQLVITQGGELAIEGDPFAEDVVDAEIVEEGVEDGAA